MIPACLHGIIFILWARAAADRWLQTMPIRNPGTTVPIDIKFVGAPGKDYVIQRLDEFVRLTVADYLGMSQ